MQTMQIISLKVVSKARWLFENTEDILGKFVKSQSMRFLPSIVGSTTRMTTQLPQDISLGADDYLFGHLSLRLKVSNLFCGRPLILTLIYKCNHALSTWLAIVIEQFIKSLIPYIS